MGRQGGSPESSTLPVSYQGRDGLLPGTLAELAWPSGQLSEATGTRSQPASPHGYPGTELRKPGQAAWTSGALVSGRPEVKNQHCEGGLTRGSQKRTGESEGVQHEKKGPRSSCRPDFPQEGVAKRPQGNADFSVWLPSESAPPLQRGGAGFNPSLSEKQAVTDTRERTEQLPGLLWHQGSRPFIQRSQILTYQLASGFSGDPRQ